MLLSCFSLMIISAAPSELIFTINILFIGDGFKNTFSNNRNVNQSINVLINMSITHYLTYK